MQNQTKRLGMGRKTKIITDRQAGMRMGMRTI